MVDSTHTPHWVQLAVLIATKRLSFLGVGTATAFCAPFKASPPAANDNEADAPSARA